MPSSKAKPDVSGTTGTGIKRRHLLGLVCAVGTAGAMGASGWLGARHQPASFTVAFRRGTFLREGELDRLTHEGLRIAAMPRSEVRIVGHTGTNGDLEANRRLSEQRAELVAGELVKSGFPAERIVQTIGVGGQGALDRAPDESDAAYQARLARVDIVVGYVR